MTVGQAYVDHLTERERKALQHACDVLIDSIFDEVGTVSSPEDVINTTIGGYLPERYTYKYTPLFLRQFAVCIITVAWKMAQPEHKPLSSVAEELAAWAIVKEAESLLEQDEEGEAPDDAFGEFIDLYFEDLDFHFLFEDKYDGIDETPVGERLGMSSLAFDDWFKPFSEEPDRVAHPYVL
jgi:hypothetical protein